MRYLLNSGEKENEGYKYFYLRSIKCLNGLPDCDIHTLYGYIRTYDLKHAQIILTKADVCRKQACVYCIYRTQVSLLLPAKPRGPAKDFGIGHGHLF